MADTGRTVFADGLWADGFWAVGLWAADAAVIVPDVDDPGTSQATAVAAIEGVGLVASITTAYSSTVPVGEVISQDPAAGSSVAPGSVVAIVVSLGAIPVQDGGGGPERRRARYEWELLMARAALRRQREKLAQAKADLAKQETPSDVQEVAEIAENSAERLEDLRSIERMVALYAEPPVTLAPDVHRAYIQAKRQADRAAYENLLRAVEVQQREEEEFFLMAATLILH